MSRGGVRFRRLPVPAGAVLLSAALAIPMPLSAAESLDGCGGRTISSLPAEIASPGRWCLAEDLATAVATGTAIRITANNVLLECNGFHVTGTADPASTAATGVRIEGRGTAVQGCRITGFRTGLHVIGDAAIVERNRVSDSTRVGIHVVGDGGTVQDNQVTTVGDGIERETSKPRLVAGVLAVGTVDVRDNLVAGVLNLGSHPGERAYAVRLSEARGSVVQRNRLRLVSRLAGPSGTGGIRIGPNATGIAVLENDVGQTGVFVECVAGATALLRDNTLQDPGTGLHSGCVDGGGNAAPIAE